MRSKLKWRHWCDYCGKAMMSKPAMARHEKGCVKNPNRTCTTCAIIEEIPTPEADRLAAARRGVGPLRIACNGCPACMLATILNPKLGIPEDCYDEPWIGLMDWDYRKEKVGFGRPANYEDR